MVSINPWMTGTEVHRGSAPSAVQLICSQASAAAEKDTPADPSFAGSAAEPQTSYIKMRREDTSDKPPSRECPDMKSSEELK